MPMQVCKKWDVKCRHLAFVLMHTQKNESQEYQLFVREFWRKIGVCVYTFLYVEKSLKALLVSIDVSFPRTHSISHLIELIEEQNIKVPDEIKDSISLTPYAVSTCYPGDFEPVDEQEYQEALEISEKVFNWVKAKIEGGNSNL